MSLDVLDLEALQVLEPRIVGIVAGALLVLFGRKLFWAFVALAGFLFGYNFAVYALGLENELASVLLGLVLGSLGALVAVFFKRLALGLAGFVVGCLGLLWVAAQGGWDTGPLVWIGALAAGGVGALLARTVFEAALVILSSMLGAALLVDGLGWRGVDPVVFFLVITGLGVVFQYLTASSRRRSRE